MTQAQKDFIAKVGAFAAADMAKSGILASLKTAQAILESGWGTSALATQANALFGIKADSRWSGRVYSTKTKECYNGVNFTTVDALFRAYDSWEHSLSNHSAFLIAGARYAAVIGERDYKKACAAIHKAGYATDPGYTDKLIKLIEQYRLMDFDTVSEQSLFGRKEQNMNIIQDIIPKGRRNRPGRANPMKFVTIHNTGNTSKGAGARNHANYVKGDSAANLPVSWHYTIDDKEIYQHIPDNEDAFHAGDGGGNGNRQSIGLEICMNSDGDLLKATDLAAQLTASLCRKHNIPIENVVQHQHWSGKNCPQLIRSGRPYDWNTFIGKVRAFMGTGTVAPVPTPATPTMPSMPTAASSTSFKVGDIVQFTGGGVYFSSTAATPAHSRGRSRCKVTQIASGRKQPFHLVSEDSGRVHGWVAAGDVTAIGSGSTPVTPATPPKPALLPLDVIAREVINGRWGNGQDRVNRLTAAGYDAKAVQARVNQLLK
ncbi:MAG: glucosaminidase domain-containing protein [Oscillospiraceae bacterium]|jgi:N-acetylmuramoyl-L-alanine amidase|nr:glucosaminidase domain-containing protein [Oscillospiraceae bacterium]